MPARKLTEEVRRELKKPLGLLLPEKDEQTAGRLKRILEEHRTGKTVVVGDYTAKRILENRLSANVIVLDNKTMRKNIAPLATAQEQTIRVRNPASTITEEAWKAVKEAMKSSKKTEILVDGEEDLLTLPAILFSPVGSLVMYGQPQEGVVVVEVTRKKKIMIGEIVDKMERD